MAKQNDKKETTGCSMCDRLRDIMDDLTLEEDEADKEDEGKDS